MDIWLKWGFHGGSVVKNLPANVGDAGNMDSIPGLERSPGEENGNPLQCSCLRNTMDREVWSATVHGVTKNHTGLSAQTVIPTFAWNNMVK